MTDVSKNPSLSLVSLLSLERIDAICTSFEDALASDCRPRIEDFLRADSEHENRLLLREMLQLELSHKQSQGLTVTKADYETRFSHYKGMVQEAFEQVSSAPIEKRDYTGKRVAERYRVGSLLGAGAFSDVYLAEDLEKKRCGDG